MRVFRRSHVQLLAIAALLTLGSPQQARPQPADAVWARVDSMIAKAFPSNAPGVVVLVTSNGRVVFRKAYGLANLETNTPMRPEMVFELGSVTKQFTSTAILMLVEQRKVALDDDIRTYVPEFPDKGVRITIEHLLTHTSGIKDYTEDPKWPQLWRQDLSPLEVVNLTKDAPLDFAPGTRWRYDNTGYTLLGMVIEKASGTGYADFISKNIFEPLRMTYSSYASTTNIVPNRASGYTKGEKGWENAPYLSMTQPYAAGALMSTVDDLALWEAAVSARKLLSTAAWEKAFADHRLADGEDARYGYGWELGSYEGHQIVHHAGGIPGYTTEVLRMPQDHVYIAVLANSDSVPVDVQDLAARIAGEAIGQPYKEPAIVSATAEQLERYAGAYRFDASSTRAITRDGTQLYMQRSGGPKVEIFPFGENVFFRKNSFQRLSFTRDASGVVQRVVLRSLDGMPSIGERIPVVR